MMKRKEIEELHLKTNQDLKALLRKTQEELVKIRVDLQSGKLKDTQLVNKKRHDLARIKTVLRQKELNEKS